MKHLGDITKINGSDVPLVNVVIGGSPCQDLSIAGRRAGLAGERSGLFIEQIRIIKEMRQEDIKRGRKATDIRPRYMVWENVPGAFSSNKGQDFKAVLEETIKIVEKNCPDIPIPDGGWHYSGTIMGNGFSVAWRVFDAQFWGVPQRRRRIALVADFGGFTAPEILFERKGMSGNNQAVREQRETITPDTESNIRTADQQPYLIENTQEHGTITRTGICTTLAARMGTGDNNVPMVLENHPQDSRMKIKEDGIFQTMGARQGAETDPHTLMILEPQVYDASRRHDYQPFDDVSETVSETMYTLNTVEKHAVANNMVVRRLTPLECERLQGFPDNWTNIGDYIDTNGKKRKTSDTARYKALGNSIALPSWVWVLERLSSYCGDKPTMASLFDGIGGFPLIWETLNGENTCLWASEIEEFPIAVTKHHFKED